MEKILNIATGMLATFALTFNKILSYFKMPTNETLQAWVFWLTLAWLLMQMTMNAKKWYAKIKEFFRR